MTTLEAIKNASGWTTLGTDEGGEICAMWDGNHIRVSFPEDLKEGDILQLLDFTPQNISYEQGESEGETVAFLTVE